MKDILCPLVRSLIMVKMSILPNLSAKLLIIEIDYILKVIWKCKRTNTAKITFKKNKAVPLTLPNVKTYSYDYSNNVQTNDFLHVTKAIQWMKGSLYHQRYGTIEYPYKMDNFDPCLEQYIILIQNGSQT